MQDPILLVGSDWYPAISPHQNVDAGAPGQFLLCMPLIKEWSLRRLRYHGVGWREEREVLEKVETEWRETGRKEEEVLWSTAVRVTSVCRF